MEKLNERVLNASLPCSEPLNIEEEEVCKMIRECLDLRKKYIYKENVVPWKAEPVETNPDPFHFEPVEATGVCCLSIIYLSLRYFLIYVQSARVIDWQAFLF